MGFYEIEIRFWYDRKNSTIISKCNCWA